MIINRPIEEIIGQFFNNYEKLNKMFTHLHKEQSEIDRELSDFYHRMEGLHLSHNTQAHKHIIKLQDILNRRRNNKKAIILISSFLDTTKDSMETALTRTRKATKNHNRVLSEIQNLKYRDKMRKHKK